VPAAVWGAREGLRTGHGQQARPAPSAPKTSPYAQSTNQADFKQPRLDHRAGN